MKAKSIRKKVLKVVNILCLAVAHGSGVVLTVVKERGALSL